MNNAFKKHISSPFINWLGRAKERKHFTKAPILIGGCARSGTTLLLAILSAHPRLFCFPKETDAFTEWVEKEGQLDPVRLDRMYRELLLARIPRYTHRWCEKRPYNVLYIREILKYFGSQARFIHIIRDPRAVCTSTHPDRPDAYWVTPERYIHDVNAGLKFKDHGQVFTVRYEDLITNFKAIIYRLCEFLNEEPCQELLNWYEHATVRSNRAWFSDLETLKTDSLHKWKAPEHAERVRSIMQNDELRELMRALEYE